MSIESDLIGQTFQTVLYESVIGKIVALTEILIDGTLASSLWVIYPDGVGEEVLTIQQAEELLEL